MSKQTSRQTSKRGQSANKQSNNQSSKQVRPANKQIASGSVKQSNSATKPPTRQAMKQERREEEKQRQLNAKRRAARNKRILIGSLVAAAVVLIAAVSFAVYSANAHKSTTQKPNSLPTEQVFNSAYPDVDGIYCDPQEKLVYHIHVHLKIYINGQNVVLPQGVGIAPNICLYWLHVHANDGIIHIESPSEHIYTLANLLDIWQSFGSSQINFPTQLASPVGWTIYVNGQKVNGDFKGVNLTAHELITIAYNSPNVTPETSFEWPTGE